MEFFDENNRLGVHGPNVPVVLRAIHNETDNYKYIVLKIVLTPVTITTTTVANNIVGIPFREI